MSDAYTTQTLIGVVRDLKLPSTFLLDTFFPSMVESTVQEVAIDIEKNTRRLAPFVSPKVQGKVMDGPGQETRFFSPAYLKPKSVPDVDAPLKRQVGETLGGATTPGAREDLIIAAILADHMAQITRRLNWMAASALASGTVTVAGDGYASQVVNFLRDAALTVTLTGAARWGQSGVVIGDYLEDAADLVLQKSGSTVTDIVFTKTPGRMFKKEVKADLLIPNQNDISISLGGQVVNGARFMGTWGMFRCWMYNEYFVDPTDGAEKSLIADGKVILGSADIQGTRHFGAIKDPAFAYGALAFAPKSWLEHDPAQRVLMTQSAPLVVPTRPDASFCATVI